MSDRRRRSPGTRGRSEGSYGLDESLELIQGQEWMKSGTHYYVTCFNGGPFYVRVTLAKDVLPCGTARYTSKNGVYMGEDPATINFVGLRRLFRFAQTEPKLKRALTGSIGADEYTTLNDAVVKCTETWQYTTLMRVNKTGAAAAGGDSIMSSADGGTDSISGSSDGAGQRQPSSQELNEILDQVRVLFAQTERRNDDTEHQLTSKAAELDSLQQQYKLLEVVREQLQAKEILAADLQAEKTQTERQLALTQESTQNQLKTLQDRLDEHGTRLTNTQSELQASSTASTRYMHQVADLTHQLAQSKSEANDLQRQVAELTSHSEMEATQLDTVQKELEEKVAYITQIELRMKRARDVATSCGDQSGRTAIEVQQELKRLEGPESDVVSPNRQRRRSESQTMLAWGVTSHVTPAQSETDNENVVMSNEEELPALQVAPLALVTPRADSAYNHSYVDNRARRIPTSLSSSAVKPDARTRRSWRDTYFL